MHYDKKQIKLGAAIQREQQRQKVEELLQQGTELELTQEEMEEKTWREDAKQQRVQRRAKEKEEKEEDETSELKDLVVAAESANPAGSSGLKETKTKNPWGGKKKQEAIVEEFEEEEEEEKAEETMRKRKAVGCINLQEAAEFQNFVKDRMVELVDEMRSEKNLIHPVWKLIRLLKLQYDKVHLFEKQQGSKHRRHRKYYTWHQGDSLEEVIGRERNCQCWGL